MENTKTSFEKIIDNIIFASFIPLTISFTISFVLTKVDFFKEILVMSGFLLIIVMAITFPILFIGIPISLFYKIRNLIRFGFSRYNAFEYLLYFIIPAAIIIITIVRFFTNNDVIIQ